MATASISAAGTTGGTADSAGVAGDSTGAPAPARAARTRSIRSRSSSGTGRVAPDAHRSGRYMTSLSGPPPYADRPGASAS